MTALAADGEQIMVLISAREICHTHGLIAGADPGRVQRVPWNPPFERASLTRDTLIEQLNRDTLIEQSQ